MRKRLVPLHNIGKNRPLVLFLLVISFAGLGASESGQFVSVIEGGRKGGGGGAQGVV
jgi:hypothetical protein